MRASSVVRMLLVVFSLAFLALPIFCDDGCIQQSGGKLTYKSECGPLRAKLSVPNAQLGMEFKSTYGGHDPLVFKTTLNFGGCDIKPSLNADPQDTSFKFPGRTTVYFPIKVEVTKSGVQFKSGANSYSHSCQPSLVANGERSVIDVKIDFPQPAPDFLIVEFKSDVSLAEDTDSLVSGASPGFIVLLVFCGFVAVGICLGVIFALVYCCWYKKKKAAAKCDQLVTAQTATSVEQAKTPKSSKSHKEDARVSTSKDVKTPETKATAVIKKEEVSDSKPMDLPSKNTKEATADESQQHHEASFNNRGSSFRENKLWLSSRKVF